MTKYLLPMLLLTASPLAAGTLKQQQGAATLELEFPGESPTLSLADLLAVTLTIEGHASLRVRAPDDIAANAPWQLVERSTPKRDRIGPERVRWQLRYRFAPRELGKKIPFAFPEVVVREKEDVDRSIKFEPIVFEVVSAIAANEPGELRDITAIEELPIEPIAETDWRGLALASVVIGVISLTFVIRWMMRRPRFRSNADIALYEMQRLSALNLLEANRSERFVTLMTLIIRRFLERQFGIPARRQTTAEFLRQLAQHSAFTSEERIFLAEFLQRSEAVKYANQSMSRDECQRWADAVEQFLQRRAKS